MGRRTRKRSAAAPARSRPAREPVQRARAAEQPRRRARLDEAPKAPWHPFPLVELCILVGMILIAVGASGIGDGEGTLLALGLVLVGLGAIEVTIREHFAGYRSHTSLLALCAAFAVGVPLWFSGLVSKGVLLGIAVVVAALAWWGLREAFRRRAGGLGFRA